ncbi:longifolia 1-like protein [Tanacetum coccineum]
MISFLTHSASVFLQKINHKKLQTIKYLVQKLTRLNSTHDEAHTDYIASLSENIKPDDRICVNGDERLRQGSKKKEDVSLDEEDDGLKTILWEEVLNRAESWTDYDGEHRVIALEVERLIFKDLVNEVVLGEASPGKRIQPGCCSNFFFFSGLLLILP